MPLRAAYRVARNTGTERRGWTGAPLRQSILWQAEAYIEPPLPPAPPSMRKARSRQSLTRSLASLDGYGATGCCLTCSRRLAPSAHRFKQVPWPWQRASHAVSAKAVGLAATRGLAARRQAKRALRMGCSFWDGAIIGSSTISILLTPDCALHSSIFPVVC